MNFASALGYTVLILAFEALVIVGFITLALSERPGEQLGSWLERQANRVPPALLVGYILINLMPLFLPWWIVLIGLVAIIAVLIRWVFRLRRDSRLLGRHDRD